MTHAEELRAAGATLRQTAAKATPGPWVSLNDGDRLIQLKPDGETFAYVVDEPMSHAGNAAWIALANPEIAEPLAAWLEAEARHWDAVRVAGAVTPGPEALAVARVINQAGAS